MVDGHALGDLSQFVERDVEAVAEGIVALCHKRIAPPQWHWYVWQEDDDTYDDEPSPLELEAMAAEDPDSAARARVLDLLGVTRALGHDVTPGHDELHHYWTVGPGLAKWAESPKPWTTLVAHLPKYVGPEKAKVYASRWFIEVFHFAAGSDLNRVTHGKPPRGHRVGPG